ncbi:MAG TPA: hypothetical protein VJ227_04170 [Patescibacteria group bacterium]|nr:hypothetical protein [Patescibacteria group bacterium]
MTKFLTITIAIASLLAAILFLRPAKKEFAPNLPVVASDPTPVPSQLTTVRSPDGKATLVMRERKEEGGTTYTFTVSSEKDPSYKEIFTKTLAEGGITIPFNTFSPDDKYILLKENLPGGTRYFVVALANGQIFEASDLFAEKFGSDYVVSDATGWGGLNLVVINTQKVGGGSGPSFWFEVPSQAFIRLSHSF